MNLKSILVLVLVLMLGVYLGKQFPAIAAVVPVVGG